MIKLPPLAQPVRPFRAFVSLAALAFFLTHPASELGGTLPACVGTFAFTIMLLNALGLVRD